MTLPGPLIVTFAVKVMVTGQAPVWLAGAAVTLMAVTRPAARASPARRVAAAARMVAARDLAFIGGLLFLKAPFVNVASDL
jgi:hypothetical protein